MNRTSPQMRGLSRRALLSAALPLALGPIAARAADSRPSIADMHSHFGLITRPTLPSSDFSEDLRANRIALIAWALPSDFRWIGPTANGLEQTREPEPGELSAFFRGRLDQMKTYVERSGLRPVLASADVDFCLAGDSGVVLASEGADLLEGRVETLSAFYAQGLRHLQLVHFIRNPISDFQTTSPTHNGLSDAGRRLVEACNAVGVLVDLAHCTWPAVEQALKVTTKPLLWSHGWVDQTEGRWQDGAGYLQRRLSISQAKKIADRGGVVGLWGLALDNPGSRREPGQGNWTVARGDTRSYAREIANLVNWIGEDHVGIGTDIEGVGTSWSVNNYSHMRSVVEALQDLKLPAIAIEKVACRNYARVLKAAMRTG